MERTLIMLNLAYKNIPGYGRLISFEGTPFKLHFEVMPQSLNAERLGANTVRMTILEQDKENPEMNFICDIFEQDCFTASWLWNMGFKNIRKAIKNENRYNLFYLT